MPLLALYRVEFFNARLDFSRTYLGTAQRLVRAVIDNSETLTETHLASDYKLSNFTMLAIRYKPVNFSSTLGMKLSYSQTLYCSWSDLVWSAITVGRKNWRHVIRYGYHSQFEMVYRSALLFANLRARVPQVTNWLVAYNYPTQSSAYKELDPSEKSAISYFFGLTTAKLFAEKLLDTPWIMHLDSYKQSLSPQIANGGRPDLVGLDKNSNWIVIEAKGRSNELDRKVVNRAKEQAGLLVNIAGQKTRLNIGFVCYFSNQDYALQIHLQDPTPSEVNGFELNIETNDYLLDYYYPILEFLVSDHEQTGILQHDNDRSYIFKRIPEADIQIGLDREVLSLLTHQKREFSSNDLISILAKTWSDTSAKADDYQRKITLGSDGVYIALGDSWSNEKMFQEPEER